MDLQVVEMQFKVKKNKQKTNKHNIQNKNKHEH